MEESSEVQYEENKELSDKNKRRRFKTPSQLQALEEFYNDHKYPTESMKAELANKLGLTDKQVSGWFCHRRLKDKRLLKEESNAPVGKHDLSSGVVQDRGSGLKQDSCSSTKQGEDYRVADLREVESRRFGHNDHHHLAATELNYEVYDGTEADDTSSESDSDIQESFYPKNRNPLDVETTKYRAPNGFIAKERARAGPSGYLKIKGQTENAAITAVKRQLGRLYREDGPPLGVEFDPLPPEAFEFPSKNTGHEVYRVQESMASGSGLHKGPGLNTKRNPFPKQKPSFPNQSQGLHGQKSSSGVDSCPPRELSDDDPGNNHINNNHVIHRKRDLSSGMRPEPFLEQPQPYPEKGASRKPAEEPWSPSYDNVNPKMARKRERLDLKAAAMMTVRPKNPINGEDRVPTSRVPKDEEVYMERRPMEDHHDSVRLKKCPTNEFRNGKRGREEFSREDYAIKTSPQGLSQWSKQVKGSTADMPSSFSEDETAETSSSVD